MGSSPAELARDEAERVEAEANETPDTPRDPDDADDPDTADPASPDETPQAPPDQVSEAMLEQRMKAWDRERDRHMRELNKRDPNRYDVSEPCPLCDGHGLFLPDLPEPDRTARREYIVTALGGEAPPELRDATDKTTCDACDGWGQTRTGSKVGGQDALPCAGCNGQGWKYRGSPAIVPQPTWAPPVQNIVAPPAPNGVGPLDAWQRPIGHPDYGRPPAEVGV